MSMEKKDIKKIIAAFLIILLMALAFDITKENIGEDGTITRNEIGEDEKEVQLVLNMEGYEDDYEYPLEIEPVRVTEEQAKQYMDAAIREIDEDIAQRGASVPIKEVYQSGIVEAEWSFDPWNVINSDGTVVQEKVPEEGLIVSAEVHLYCGAYEQIYQFAFELKKEELTVEERVLAALDEWLVLEMQKEGEEILQLPQEIEGVALSWSTKSDSLTAKILLLEVLAAVLLWYMQKKSKEDEKRKLEEKMELDYPDIVEQLALLLGAGMTIRQAWNRIATRYSDKRQKEQIEEKPVFEQIVHMNRRMNEGENERIAYQKFADEVGIMCYYRLIRSLLTNLEKGSVGMNAFLEQESRQAYEQRINHAKKLGEEASTRMLLPLMLMMVVVMAIVMLPAMVNFTI